MSGNDIVDITVAAAESNWRRKGFLEKIFTPQEQHYVKNSTNADEMVWKLWSMKESVYKIYTRQHGGRFFSPQKFSCSLLSATTGLVTFNNISYQTTTISAKKYIYTIATLNEFINTEWLSCCFYLPAMEHNEQQQFIYKKIVDRHIIVTGERKEDTSVVKDKNGIPFLHCFNNVMVPISITHHGSFAAFTIN